MTDQSSTPADLPEPAELIRATIEGIVGDLNDLAARLPGLTQSDVEIARRLALETAGVAELVRRLPHELLATFAARGWEISEHPAGLKVYTATWRVGTSVRALVGHNAFEIISAMISAEAEGLGLAAAVGDMTDAQAGAPAGGCRSC